MTRSTGILTVAFLMAVFAAASVFAQDHATDAAAQKAREEAEVVFDLGRIIQFMMRMDVEMPILALDGQQARDLLVIMNEIRRSTRVDASQAERWLTTIEDDVLTPAQLAFVDRLFIERTSTSARGTNGGTGTRNPSAGAGTDGGAGSMSSYIAGGPFNPIVDTSRAMGQDFEKYFELLMERR